MTNTSNSHPAWVAVLVVGGPIDSGDRGLHALANTNALESDEIFFEIRRDVGWGTQGHLSARFTTEQSHSRVGGDKTQGWPSYRCSGHHGGVIGRESPP